MTEPSKEEFENLVRSAIRSFEGMSNSKIFLALLSPGAMKDPIVCMQLGMAVLLDKPIYLVVQKGLNIPANLRSMAIQIVETDMTDPEAPDAKVKEMIRKAMKGN